MCFAVLCIKNTKACIWKAGGYWCSPASPGLVAPEMVLVAPAARCVVAASSPCPLLGSASFGLCLMFLLAIFGPFIVCHNPTAAWLQGVPLPNHHRIRVHCGSHFRWQEAEFAVWCVTEVGFCNVNDAWPLCSTTQHRTD